MQERIIQCEIPKGNVIAFWIEFNSTYHNMGKEYRKQRPFACIPSQPITKSALTHFGLFEPFDTVMSSDLNGVPAGR